MTMMIINLGFVPFFGRENQGHNFHFSGTPYSVKSSQYNSTSAALQCSHYVRCTMAVRFSTNIYCINYISFYDHTSLTILNCTFLPLNFFYIMNFYVLTQPLFNCELYASTALLF